MLGLRFCARSSSSCGKRGPLFIAVRGPLTIVAPPAAEHRLQTRRLSSCGPRAQPLRGTWDPPRPGPEPVSPALAGRLPTTAPPGKPAYLYMQTFKHIFKFHFQRFLWLCLKCPLLHLYNFIAEKPIEPPTLSYLPPNGHKIFNACSTFQRVVFFLL